MLHTTLATALALALPLPTCASTAPEDEVVLTLRVVDAVGAPLGVERVVGTLDEHFGRPDASGTERLELTVWRAPLDDAGDGRLRLALDAPRPDGPRLLVLEDARRGPSGPGARLDLAAFGPGAHDLGTVALAPPPTLVAGRVRDAAGAPAAGALVQLERRWMGPVEGPATWNPVVGVDARTDDEGRFTLRGWVGTDALRVVASGRGLAPGALEVRAGEQAAELALGATGSILGRALLDARCGPGSVAVELFRDGRVQRAVPVGAGGSFVFPDVVPGTVTLRFRAQQDLEPALVVEGVVVRGAERAPDARLTGVDLRGRVRCLRVELLLPGGDRPGPHVAGVRAPGAAEYRRFWAQGDLELATAAPALELLVRVPGCRTERLARVDADRAVQLRPGLPVRVALAGGAVALREDFGLRIALEPMAAEDRFARTALVPPDAAGEARVLAADLGPHRLLVYVHRATTGEDFELPERLLEPARVEVEERDAEQRVTVRLDRAELARMVERIGHDG